MIPDIAIIARNVDTGVQQNATSNADGFYALTTLPVGRYEIETLRPGFKPYKHAALTIDVGTKLQLDITMELGEQSDQITVSDTGVRGVGDDCGRAQWPKFYRPLASSAWHRPCLRRLPIRSSWPGPRWRSLLPAA